MLSDWKIENGYLYAGSVRIAKMDLDKKFTDAWKRDAEKFIVDKLNEPPSGPKEWNSCWDSNRYK